MSRAAFVFAWLMCVSGSCLADSGVDIVVAVGASGTDEYGEEFSRWTEHWRGVAEDSGATIRVIGNSDKKNRSRGLEEGIGQLSRRIRCSGVACPDRTRYLRPRCRKV